MKIRHFVIAVLLLAGPVAAQQEKKRVVEEIIARVNNEIITFSEYEGARATLRQEAEQECPNCLPAKLQEMVAQMEKNLLRDLIDIRLLVQRGKDLGFNVDTDVIKYMDRIRIDNGLPDLEALCKAVESGTKKTCEDWKNGLRENLLMQEVIRREVSREMDFSREETQKYYDAHKEEFVKPEQVFLSEILVSTEGKPESEIPALEKKAQTLLDRIRKGGEDFAEMAKRQSDGSTAQRGGELGGYKRGELAKEIEAIVFKMNRGDVSDILRTQSGFLIFHCDERYEEGQQPVDKMDVEIRNKLFLQQVESARRTYLTRLREESYLMVKPGYMDTASVASQPILEVEPVAEAEKGKDKAKKDTKKDKKPAQ